MASRRKGFPHRQLRQSNLIDSLSRCDKKEEDSANKPTVIDLEDSDPYKYVNSQSLEVSVVKNDPVRVAKTQGGSSPTTITMNTTPVQLQVSKAKRTKNKKSPAALTEEERLELQEEEDLKRALEASRQDMERAGRKRKRDKLLAAREEQSAKYEDIQKRVEKTMEVVNMARNLDGNSVLALTTRPSSGPSGEMVCDDPPSFIPSPQSSSIAALEGIVRQSGGSPTTMAWSEQDSTTSTRRVHVTPPMPVPTVQIPPSQQLKEVRVKKLNLKKYTINPVKPAAHDTLLSGPTERVKPRIEGRELSGSCHKDSINIKTPVASQSGTGETRHSPTHEGEGSTTPLLSKSTRQAHQRETAAVSIKRTPAAVGWDDSATPPLPSVSAKGQVCSSELPVSDCTEINSEEPTRPLRRNLSLSYNKKHSTQRWQSSDKKAISVDETIIMSPTSESGGPSLVSSTPPGKSSKLSSKSGSRSISLSLRRGPGDVLAKAGEGDTTKEGTRTTLLVGDGEVCSGGSEGEDVDNVSGDSSQPQSEQQSTCMELCVSQSESAPPRGTAMEAAAVSPHPKVDVRDSHVLPTVQGVTAHPRMDASDSHVLPTVQGVAAISPHPRVVDVRDSCASPGLGVTARPAVQGSRDTMKRPSSSSQSQAPKRIKLHKSKELKKDSTPLKDSRLHPPPPPLYAHKGVSPAEYSKVILNSFNSYFSQLAKAQSAVLCRLNWGKPIKSCVKQPTDSLFFSSRKTRSNSRWLNSHLRYSLKLNPRTDSNNEAASETAAQDQFSLDSFASEDDEIDFDSDTEDKIVDYTGETGLSGAGTHQVPPPTVREKEASRYTHHEPILIGTQEVGVGPGEDGSDGDGWSPGHEAILVGTQEVGVGLGEDGSNGDSLSPGHEAILVGTQDEFGATEEKSMGHMDSTNLPYNFTPSPLSSDAELGMTGTPEKQSPWLSSRKPPPSAKKTLKPKRTTKQSKKTNSSGTKVTEKCSRQSRRRGRGGGKGSAAARLICSKQSTREEPDQDQSSESDLGSDTPARFSQRRKRVSRLCTDSSEGSAEEDSLRERNPRPSRLTGSARNTGKSGLSPSRSGPNVIDLTEDLHRSTSTATASHLKHACPICTQMFAESEIELHVDECIKAKDRYGRTGRGRSRCPTCNKMFESSLVGLHTEQCCGDGESEEEEELPVIRRKRGVASGSSRGKRLSMPVSPSPEPALSPDAEDDVVEIAGCEIDDPPSPHPPSPMDTSATGSRVHGENPDDIYEREQPHCEDDLSTISTSPIRSFMRINDLDPAQRALLQNQFQTKGKGRRSGNRQLSFQHGNGWAGRDDFDELMDLGHSSGGQQGRYQNKKNWGNKKNYKNWNTNKFKRRPKRK